MFTHPDGTGEEVGVVQPVCAHGAGQYVTDPLVPQDLIPILQDRFPFVIVRANSAAKITGIIRGDQPGTVCCPNDLLLKGHEDGAAVAQDLEANDVAGAEVVEGLLKFDLRVHRRRAHFEDDVASAEPGVSGR